MQIAGEICQLCASPIPADAPAAHCPQCGVSFHQTCLESAARVCPACGEICPAHSRAQLNSPRFSHSLPPFAEGELRRPEVSPLYRLGLLAVSGGMILLPVVYLGLILFCGWGIYDYATRSFVVPDSGEPGHPAYLTAVFLLNVSVLFTGCVLILFLIKPLFAWRSKPNDYFSLEVADAPQLFSLIGWICRSLDAPIPSRVDVDCSVNASAGFRSGMRSLFGNDIVLTLGLPLVAGLSLDQLAGVIAHEYGHFSQGTAMRANYVIRLINQWFYNMVYGRDEWDLHLVEACADEYQSWWVQGFLSLVRLGLGCTRAVLWVLMTAGNFLSSFMSRQMEFDADQYEIKMAGSQSFAVTSLRLQQLNLGFDIAQRQLAAKWKKERKLFDQIPEFIVNCANEIPAEAQERHYAATSRRRTGLFDTHPSNAERIHRARAARAPGIFHDPAPATTLFADFPALSQRLTRFYYAGMIGARFKPEWLVPIAQTGPATNATYETDLATIARYFLGISSPFRPLFIAENKSVVLHRPEELLAEIRAGRRRMAGHLAPARAELIGLTQAHEQLLHIQSVAGLLQAGFQFDPVDFFLPDEDPEQARIIALNRLQNADAGLAAFESAAKAVLAGALQLLHLPHVAAAIPKVERLQDEARETIFVLAKLEPALAPVAELRQNCAALETVLCYRRSQGSADNLTATLDELCTGVQEGINQIQKSTAQMPFPFPHDRGQIFISEYLRNKQYHADPFEQVLREGLSHLEKLLALHARLLASLVLISEQVEEVAEKSPG